MEIIQQLFAWVLSMPGEAAAGAVLGGMIMSPGLRRFLLFVVGLLLLKVTNKVAGKIFSTKTGWTVISLLGIAGGGYLLSGADPGTVMDFGSALHAKFGDGLQKMGIENPAFAQLGTYALVLVVAFFLVRKLVTNTAELGKNTATKINSSPVTGVVMLSVLGLLGLGMIAANDFGVLKDYIPQDNFLPFAIAGLVAFGVLGIHQINRPKEALPSLVKDWQLWAVGTFASPTVLAASSWLGENMPERAFLPHLVDGLGLLLGFMSLAFLGGLIGDRITRRLAAAKIAEQQTAAQAEKMRQANGMPLQHPARV